MKYSLIYYIFHDKIEKKMNKLLIYYMVFGLLAFELLNGRIGKKFFIFKKLKI